MSVQEVAKPSVTRQGKAGASHGAGKNGIAPGIQGAGKTEASPVSGTGKGEVSHIPDPENIKMDASLEKARLEQEAASEMLAREAEIQAQAKKTDRAELETDKEEETDPGQAVDRKVWERLEGWRFDGQLSLGENLEDIQDLFTLLLKQILENSKGFIQIQLLAELDKITLSAFKELLGGNTPELLSFLEQYGSPDIRQKLADGFFEGIFGRRPLLLSGQGRSVYQKGPQGAQVNQDYRNSIYKAERNDLRIGLRALEQLKTPGAGQGSSASGKVYSLEDIRQAQKYAVYLKENPLSAKAGRLAYTSEEYIGFSAGVLSVKTQSFLQGQKVGEGMSRILTSAADAYIQEYFIHNSRLLRNAPEFADRQFCPPFKADDIQKVYRYTARAYQEKKDVRYSLLDGLRKAYESFSEKQKDPAYGQTGRYRPDTGFFSRMGISDLQEEMWNGWKMLCKDWEEFLRYMQMPLDKLLRLDYTAVDRNYFLSTLMGGMPLVYEKKRKPREVPYVVKWGTVFVFLCVCAGLAVLIIFGN